MKKITFYVKEEKKNLVNTAQLWVERSFFASKQVKVVIPKPNLSKTLQTAIKEISSHVYKFIIYKSCNRC